LFIVSFSLVSSSNLKRAGEDEDVEVKRRKFSNDEKDERIKALSLI